MKNTPYIIKVAEAMKFVDERHGNQMYGGYPYFFHLLQVREVAREFGLSEDVELACLLHDVLEDTATSYNDVKDLFGARVAEIVYLLTDHKGRNRHERHVLTYPEIAKDIDAVAAKFCDYIANRRFSLASRNYKKVKMYYDEYDFFMSHFIGIDKSSARISEMYLEIYRIHQEAEKQLPGLYEEWRRKNMRGV